MSNLNKIYHKGKYRSYEWAKHLRPFLKRLGNKRFRKTSTTLDDIVPYRKSKKKLGRKRIKVKITIRIFGEGKLSYYKSFRNMKDLENALKRTNIIRYTIIKNEFDK